MQSELRWLTATVRAIGEPVEEVRLFELAPDGGATHYPPGSHLDVELDVGGRRVLRSYSVVGERPQDGAWRIAVRRVADSRGGSRAMWALSQGAKLRIAAPRSHFELGFGRPEYVLVAGGIGITPLIGMAQVLRRTKHDLRLLYAGRRRAAMPFLDELRSLLGDALEIFTDEEGTRVDLAAEIARLHPEGEMYVCGPVGMMEAAQELWRRSGRPATQLRFETFGSSGHVALQPFTVQVRDRGLTLEVPRDRSLLDVLLESGTDVAYDCLRGECGLCQVTVLGCEGSIDHRDVFLSEAQKREGTRLCACVSRGTGQLVIDTGYRGGLGGTLPRAATARS